MTLDEIKKITTESHGSKKATALVYFIIKKLREYSDKFRISQNYLWELWEKDNMTAPIDHYTEENYPSLDGLIVFRDQADFLQKYPSRKYRCPYCRGVSNSFSGCDSGLLVSRINGTGLEECNWSAGGLFEIGTIKVISARGGAPDTIFMPLEEEAVRFEKMLHEVVTQVAKPAFEKCLRLSIKGYSMISGLPEFDLLEAWEHFRGDRHPLCFYTNYNFPGLACVEVFWDDEAIKAKYPKLVKTGPDPIFVTTRSDVLKCKAPTPIYLKEAK